MDNTPFEKWVEVEPAFDKRDPDPKKNYGIGSCKLRFYLRGPKGVIQFVMSSNWYLPHVRDELIYKADGSEDIRMLASPVAFDIGYHAYERQYEGQGLCQQKCQVLHGKPCYYDGSTLNAEPVMAKLISGGTEALWKELESWYVERFEKSKTEVQSC